MKRNKIKVIITLLSCAALLSSCVIKKFDMIVSKYPTFKQFFPETKWCVIVNPFTASLEDVRGFTSREAERMAVSFCRALEQSGFAAEADTKKVTLCNKRILIFNSHVTRRVIKKKYGLIVPHVFLIGIPAILGWPTTKESCHLELEVTVRIKGERHIVGVFRSEYHYKSNNNIYRNTSRTSPMLNRRIPLKFVFEKIIASVQETLSTKVQPKEVISKPSPLYPKILSTEDPNLPTLPRIPGTPNMITPQAEPIPWDSIF